MKSWIRHARLVWFDFAHQPSFVKPHHDNFFTFTTTLLFVAILLFTGDVYAQNSKEEAKKKIRIAIFDFKAGESITVKEAAMITDMVRTEMIKKKKFTVIDRENIKRVLEEQGLVQKGCTDSSCEVQLGKLLAANKIMTGSISKLGNSYIINSQVTDVEKGTNDIAEKEKTKTIDDMDSAIKDLTDKISEAMVSGAKEDSKKPVVDDEKNQQKPDSNSFTLSPIVKSALVPGWGQYANGETLKASLFFGGFLLTGGLLVSKINSFEQARNSYQANANMTLLYPSNLAILGYMNSQSLHSNYEKQGQQATTLSALAVGIYLYNVIDIAFFGKNDTVSISFLKKDGLIFNTGMQTTNFSGLEKTLSVNYTWSF